MDKFVFSQIFFMINLVEELADCNDCNFTIDKGGFSAEALTKLVECIRGAQGKHKELEHSNVEDALNYLEEILALPENFREIEINKINKSLSFYFS